MKPKTKLQKEVASLRDKVKPITAAQEAYAYRHCFDHVAFLRNQGKDAICSECGKLFNVFTKRGIIHCPHCGMILNPNSKHRTTYRDKSYYMVLDTAGRFQILRWFLCETVQRARKPALYEQIEVSQIWIAPDGRKVIVERVRVGGLYCDLFSRCRPLDIRERSESVLKSVVPYAVYNRSKITPELKQRGITANFHGLAPEMLIDALLHESHAETIYKAGQYSLLDYLISRNIPMNYYWPSIKICIRNRYTVNDGSLWCDMVSSLRYLGKDLHNPRYVCPENLKEAHDEYLRMAGRKRSREERAERRKENLKWDRKYAEMKRAFFGLSITDGEISLKVLRNLEEFFHEGEMMHHCVFENGYYKKRDSLILSATINGKRIETVEVSLNSFKVIQSRGVCNQNTEHHDRIIALVEKNMEKIRRCARKAA